jgi:hypothetical protein
MTRTGIIPARSEKNLVFWNCGNIAMRRLSTQHDTAR